MQPASEDLKNKLVTAGIGTFAGTNEAQWNIFIMQEPDKPCQTITIYDTGGPAEENCQDRSKASLCTCTLQVRVRGKTYLSVYDKIRRIHDAIIGFGGFVVDGEDSADYDVRYWGFFSRSESMFLEKNENSQFIFVENYEATRKLIK